MCPTGRGNYPPPFRYSAMSDSASGGRIVVTQPGCVLVRAGIYRANSCVAARSCAFVAALHEVSLLA